MRRRKARAAKQSNGWSSDQNTPSSGETRAIEEDPVAAKNRWIDHHRDLIRSLEAAGHSPTFSVQPDRSAETGATYGYRTELWCTACHTTYLGPRKRRGLSPERPCGPSDGPMFASAADRIMSNRKIRFEDRNRGLIDALSDVGHEPRVRVSWSTGEGGGARVSLICDRCGARRRSLLPERWQKLSPTKPCEIWFRRRPDRSLLG